VLYADYRFGWGAKMVGYTLAIVGVLGAIVQAVLIKKIIALEGERRTLLLGLLCGAAGFVLYGLAPTGYWFWAAMPIAALWGISQPAAQAIMTRQVDPHEQGRLQGAITSLASVAGHHRPHACSRACWPGRRSARPRSGPARRSSWPARLLALGFVIAVLQDARPATRWHRRRRRRRNPRARASYPYRSGTASCLAPTDPVPPACRRPNMRRMAGIAPRHSRDILATGESAATPHSFGVVPTRDVLAKRRVAPLPGRRASPCLTGLKWM
jgi:hypothetical protein